MKKNVLYIIFVSTVLLLVSWTNLGKAVETQESKAVISVPNTRAEVPDYFADGKFFNDMYLRKVPSGVRLGVQDYPADAKIFYDKYLKKPLSSEKVEFPDYPLDGRFFVDHYTELP